MRLRSTWGLSIAFVTACSASANNAGPTDAAVDRPETRSDVANDSPPANCVSDRDCSASHRVCWVDSGFCAECNANADCSAGRTCLRHICSSATHCTSSVMCPGQVCSTTVGVCVDCNVDRDCAATQMCSEGACVGRPLACSSDRECSAQHQVCDTTAGHCVACNADADCATGRYCSAMHVCAVQACVPGMATCIDATHVRTCDVRGMGTSDTACAAGQTCQAGVCVAVDAGVVDVLSGADVVDVPAAIDVPDVPDAPVVPDVPAVVDVPDVPDAPADADTRCPAGMNYIPAGMFLMGDPMSDDPSAQPVHGVRLDAFCMDVTEVTVAAYRDCTASRCTLPDTTMYCNWNVTGRDTHPINCIDWNQMRAFCQWRGGDLPTEAQWEYAAHGTDGRTYPWPNSAGAPSDSLLCWNRYPTPGQTCPVQSHPAGNSPFGLSDMAGNVGEMTLDWYAPYTGDASSYVSNPTGPASGAMGHVSRGGDWTQSTAIRVRSALRGYVIPALYRTYLEGFRCARSPL